MKDRELMTAVNVPTLEWSKFALSRHRPGTGYPFFTEHAAADVVELVRRNWLSATPGDGEKDLERKVVVPIHAENFFCTSVPLKEGMLLHSEVYLHNKNFAIRTIAEAKAAPAKFVNVVCFSADAVLESFGERSGNSEWEIILLLATQVPHEPMHPLAMARNLLERPGGVESKYTAKEFAESVFYWSQRVQVNGMEAS